MIPDDPILREIREERTRNAEKYGGDIEAMLRDLQERQQEREAKLLRLPPNKTRKADGTGEIAATSAKLGVSTEIDDSILREIREGREENARKYGEDTAAMLRDLKKRQEESGVKTVRLSPRRLEKPAETSQ